MVNSKAATKLNRNISAGPSFEESGKAHLAVPILRRLRVFVAVWLVFEVVSGWCFQNVKGWEIQLGDAVCHMIAGWCPCLRLQLVFEIGLIANPVG